MNPALNLRWIPSALLLFSLMRAPLAAQHVLLAEDGGKMSLVCAARGTIPCVEKNGKIEPITTRGYIIKDAPEYFPVFIFVRDLKIHTGSTSVDGVSSINNNFFFSASFETPYRLKDVFLVLDIDTESAGKTLYLCEIGELEPNKTKPLSIAVPMKFSIGDAYYTLHLFSGGSEVLQSEIPLQEREQALDQMIAKRIKDVHEAGPSLYIGPEPEYPAKLKKANLSGKSVISVRIGANGAVYDPVVKSATDPAFGDAALTAVRLWRFLPLVKDDHAIETKADVPFVFVPPGPAKDTH